MNDDLHTFIEPELQARIAALVLGEASEFESDELEKLIAEKPELAIYQRRIEAMHDLLGETVKPVPDLAWKLSDQRRDSLRKAFAKKNQPSNASSGSQVRSTARLQVRAAVAIAACVLFTVILFFMATPVVLRSVKSSEAPAENNMQGGLDLDEDAYMARDGIAAKSEKPKMRMKEMSVADGKDSHSSSWRPSPRKAREVARKVERKPSAPSSSMAKVIASAAKSPNAIPVPNTIPVPDLKAAKPSVTYGNDDDFGDGWAKGDKNGAVPGAGGDGGDAGGREMAEAEADPFAAPVEEEIDLAKNGIAGKKQSIDRVMRQDSLRKRVGKLGKGSSDGDGRHYNFRGQELPKSGAVLESTTGEVAELRGRKWHKTADKQQGRIVDAFERADQSGKGNGSANNQLGYSAGPANHDLSNVAAALTSARRGGLKKDASILLEKKLEEGENKSKGRASDVPLIADGLNANTHYTGAWKSHVANEVHKADVDFLSRDEAGEIPQTPATPADSEERIGETYDAPTTSKTGANYYAWSIGDDVKSSEDESKKTLQAIPLISEDGTDSRASKVAKKYKRKAEVLNAALEVESAPDGGVTTELNLKVGELTRNNPAAVAEHAQKVDEVRKNLYRVEGYYNLGQFDKAEEEMKKVLRTDPYNKAARRWLEKVNHTKSEYHRAAYDETRAQLLMEVDKAWELDAPAPEVRTKTVSQVDKPKPVVQSVVTNGKTARPKALPEETLTRAEPFSTFSLNVNDVSFKLARVELLEKGKWPNAAKVRTEEFVNAFDYGDPSPRRGEPVACAIEQSAHPFLQQRNLLRVGMKTAAMGRSQPLRLTVLLDNSGSMEREDREASVLAAMEVLAAQLNPQDVITVVSFARQPRLIADRVPGHQAAKLVDLVSKIPSEGGTNLEEALRLARKLAKRQHTEGAQSRVVLITDGVANLGNTVPEELSSEVETMRQQGIAFDACGVGAEGLNDEILEAMTRKGDGRYYFLNRPEDADDGFAKQLAGALTPAAKNVKVQVVFNPKRVSRYRLLGFEKHRLNKQDFRNDKVDAAEMAAEEAGNAVYQIQVNPQGEGELGEVFVRFLDASTGRMVERSWPLAYQPQAKPFDLATPSMQLAGTAAMLGEKLHGTDAGSVSFSTISDTLGKIKAHYASDTRVQDLIRMCRKAE